MSQDTDTNNDGKMQMHMRNTKMVEDKLKELDNSFREQQQQIKNLNNYIASLEMKFNQLEQRLNIDKIMKVGTGPTVRD